jgi:hypothetical protein
MLRWAWCGFHKKSAGTYYAELVFLHPVGSVGQFMHFGPSGARNVDALFFRLGWADMDCIKSEPAHIMPNLCLCIRWDLRVT